MRAAAGALLASAALLAGCASVPPEPSPVAALRGWAEEDHLAAFKAYQATCAAAADPASKAVCARARALHPRRAAEARTFFEANFRPEPLGAAGLLTAYFSPVYEARTIADEVFSAPLRPPDAALVHATRAEIEAAPAQDALAWMRPEDLYFLQIQGSGVLRLPDGSALRAAYAADNGRAYVPVGRVLLQRGLVAPGGADAMSIHAWLCAHRGEAAQAIMQANPRYIFFRLQPDDGGEPPGAAGVRLVPGRSLAIDPAEHRYGELLWVEAAAPALQGARAAYRRLAVALDTGAAIRGAGRADLYLGRGEAAGLEAGRVRHALRLTRLIPLAATGSPAS